MIVMSLVLCTLFIIIFIPYCLNHILCGGQDIDTSSNPCDTYGRCGAFSSCYSMDSPICSCLQGFYPVNRHEWNAGNWSSGCESKVPLGCVSSNGKSDGSRGDGFLNLLGMKFSGYSDRWFGDESQCGDQCLSNCSCVAYGYHSNFCMFWRGTLLDIQGFDCGEDYRLHLQEARSQLVPNRTTNNHEALETSVSIVSSHQEVISQVNLEEYLLLQLEILANAIDNFSNANELGKGGFGRVYKGQMADGREIAVKRLSKASGQGLQEFMNEVVLISKLQHRNLVRLLGCCVENKENMLAYEFMPNKSLDVLLFDQTQEILDWRKRVNIIKGICRGLLYLHRDSRLKIIHRDLKPSNILLDHNWNPRISDFGMARIYGSKQHHVSTARVVGTYGYMAPEYAMEGRFSEKFDVFNVGVMILEIATGRRNSSFIHDGGSINLLGHIWKLWTEDNVTILIDSRISSPSYRAEIMRCVHIGLLCVQELPVDRPSISAILSMLNSEIMDVSEPKEAAFSVRSSRSTLGTSSSQSSEKNTNSFNNLRLTLVDGR